METWKATIKEKDNEHLLTPTYAISKDALDYFTDERQREYEIRKYLKKFWGLDNPDVEWYKLERI